VEKLVKTLLHLVGYSEYNRRAIPKVIRPRGREHAGKILKNTRIDPDIRPNPKQGVKKVQPELIKPPEIRLQTANQRHGCLNPVHLPPQPDITEHLYKAITEHPYKAITEHRHKAVTPLGRPASLIEQP